MIQWPAQFDKVFRLLKKLVGGHNGRWMACCPSHSDNRQSLSVSVGRTGKLMLRCHAPQGCDIYSITRALGIRLADLRGSMSNREFVEAYDYRDEKGTLLMQAVRWRMKESGEKSFSQRKPNPKYDPKQRRSDTNREYIGNIEGVRRVLYRWPELARALKKKSGRMVFVMEGEKATNLAWKNGLLATNSLGGALKWHLTDPACLEVFRGAHVVIWPDNDPVLPNLGFSPGRKHAEEVAQSLAGIALSVKIMPIPPDMPEGGDFYDWWTSYDRGEVKFSPEQRRQLLREMLKETAKVQPGETKKPEPKPEGAPPAKKTDWDSRFSLDDAPAKKEPEPAKPKAAEPAKAQSEPQPAGKPPIIPHAVLRLLDALEGMRAKPGCRSKEEWLGAVLVEWNHASAVSFNGAGEQALGMAMMTLAATIVRGFESLPEFARFRPGIRVTD